MKTLTVPKRVTESVRRLRPTLRTLETKRVNSGLTEQEKAELDTIYAEMEQSTLSEQDVTALAESHAEARRPHYHDLPIARNYHE